MGIPAWAPDGSAIAFANARRARHPARGRRAGRAGDVRYRQRRRAGPPDSRSLVYSTGSGAAHGRASPAARRRSCSARRRVGAADWQPCTAGVTASCESVAPPRCSATTVSATTQADQPVDLPAAPCTDPAGRPLSVVVVKAPERGTLSGLRYTPAAGFTGQDTLAYRVSNGVAESETVRVTVFVLPRPVTAARGQTARQRPPRAVPERARDAAPGSPPAHARAALVRPELLDHRAADRAPALQAHAQRAAGRSAPRDGRAACSRCACACPRSRAARSRRSGSPAASATRPATPAASSCRSGSRADDRVEQRVDVRGRRQRVQQRELERDRRR